MSKKDAKIAKAAHIKRRTEGTSNELSFSVLDAAKNRADAEEGKDTQARVLRLGNIALFSLPGRRKKMIGTPTKENSLPLSDDTLVPGQSMGSSDSRNTVGKLGASLQPGSSSVASGFGSTVSVPTTLSYASAEDEIVRRKTRRRRHRVLMTVGCVLLAVGLLGGGGYYLYSEAVKHGEQVSLLEQALKKIDETGETISAMNDQVLSASTPVVSRDTLSAIIEKIPETQQQLSAAASLTEQAMVEMRDSADKEAAGQALTAIQTRQEMLSLGQEILEGDLQEINDREALVSAWELVLQADTIAREAAALVTETTNENVTASREKSAEAQQMFNEARYQLELVAASFLAPDIQNMLDYVAKRVEAMEYAILSDDAILAQDRQTAQAQNEAYNAADNEAVTMAKSLPEPTQVITQAHKNATEGLREQYKETYSKACTADAFLRDYLGTEL